MILPIEDSLLYVLPVFLESEEAQIPEFERVVVVLGETVAWGTDFEDAVIKLYEKRTSGGDGSQVETQSKPGEDDGTEPSGTSADVVLTDDQRIKEISGHYEKAVKCQRDGDWTCYGREMDEIGRLLKEN